MNLKRISILPVLVLASSSSFGGGQSYFELKDLFRQKRSAQMMRSYDQRAAPSPDSNRRQDSKVHNIIPMQKMLRTPQASGRGLRVPQAVAKPAVRPAPALQRAEVFVLGDLESLVAVPKGFYSKLGPKEDPKAKPPKPPKNFTAGVTEIEADLESLSVRARWSLRRLDPEAKTLQASLPSSLFSLRIQGKPGVLNDQGMLLLPDQDRLEIELEYLLSRGGNNKWGSANFWLPPAALHSIQVRNPPEGSLLRLEEGTLVPGSEATPQFALRTNPKAEISWEPRNRLLGSQRHQNTKKSEVQATSFHFYELRGKSIEIEAEFEWAVSPPGVNRLSALLPAGVELLEVREGTKPWESLAVQADDSGAKRLLLGLPARRSGSIRARLTLSVQAPRLEALDQKGGEAVVPLPRILPLEVSGATEFFGLEKDPRTRIRKAEGPMQGKSRHELPSLAQTYVPRIDGPVGRFMDRKSGISVRVERLRSLPSSYFQATQAKISTLLGATEKMALHRFELEVQNSTEQFLEVLLPPNARLLGAEVRGEPVKPGTHKEDPNRILIALPGAGRQSLQPPQPFPLAISYLTPTPELRTTQSFALELPRAQIDIEAFRWILAAPSTLELERLAGDFEVPTRSYSEIAYATEKKIGSVASMAIPRRNKLAPGRVPTSQVLTNFAELDAAEVAPEELGLLPVQIDFQAQLEGKGLDRLVLVRKSLERGAKAPRIELSVRRGDRQTQARQVSLLVLFFGLFLLGLGCFGASTVRVGLGFTLLGILLALRSPLDSAFFTEAFQGLGVWIFFSLAWMFFLPIRRLEKASLPILILGLWLTPAKAESSERIEVLVPLEGEATPWKQASQAWVLVPEGKLEALRKETKELSQRPSPKPSRAFAGVQSIDLKVEPNRASFRLVSEFRLEGPGPHRLELLRGNLGLQSWSVEQDGRPLAKAQLQVEQDREIVLLDRATEAGAKSTLARGEAPESPKVHLPYELVLPKASKDSEGVRSIQVEVRGELPVDPEKDGRIRLSFTPHDAAQRSLEVEVDPRVRIENSWPGQTRSPRPQGGTRIQTPIPRRGAVELQLRSLQLPGRSSNLRVAPSSGSADPRRDSRPPVVLASPDRVLLANWTMRFEVREESVEGVAVLDLTSYAAGLESFRVRFPETWKVRKVEGNGVYDHRTLAAEEGWQDTEVFFQSQKQGENRIVFALRISLRDAKQELQDQIELALPRLEGAAQESAELGLSVQGSQEIEADEVEGFEPARPQAGEVLAFRSPNAKAKLTLGIRRPLPARISTATITSYRARTQLESGELRKIQVEIQVENNGKDFLTFRLPEGTKNESIRLTQVQSGRERVLPKVLDRHDNLQIPLPQPGAGSRSPAAGQFRLEVHRKAALPEGSAGEDTLYLPTPDVPVSGQGLVWNVLIEKGKVLRRLDPVDGSAPLWPHRSQVEVQVAGYLSSQNDPGIQMKIQFSKEGRYLAELGATLFGFFLLGVGFAVGTRRDSPLPVALRATFAALLIFVAGLALGGSPLAPTPLLAGLAFLGWVLMTIVHRIRSWRAAALALLALSPGALSADPAGVDVRYLEAPEAARFLKDGWTSVRLSEVEDVILERERAKAKAEIAKTPPSSQSEIQPLSGEIDVRLSSEHALVRLRYRLERSGPKEIPWVVDLGPDAGLASWSAKDSRGREVSVVVVPSGGLGSPNQGHPQVGLFEVHGLPGDQEVEVEFQVDLPVLPNDRGGVLQVACSKAPSMRYRVDPGGQELDLEVYPALTREAPSEGTSGPIQGALPPTRIVAVAWTSKRPRTTPVQKAPPKEPMYDAQIYTASRVQGDRLWSEHEVVVPMTQGSLDKLSLQLPEDEVLVSLSGGQILRWGRSPESPSPKDWTVVFRSLQKDTIRFRLKTLRVLPPETSKELHRTRTLVWAPVHIQGAQHETSELSVSPAPGASLSHLSLEGASRQDPSEASRRPLAHGYYFRSLANDYRIQAQQDRIANIESKEMKGHSAKIVVVPLDSERWVLVGEARIRTQGYQSLTLRLPPQSHLISAQVQGQPVHPVVAGAQEVRIPLSSLGARDQPQEFSLETVILAPQTPGKIYPPAILEAPLESLEVVLGLDPGTSARVRQGPYSDLNPSVSFFRPVEEFVQTVPKVLGGILLSPFLALSAGGAMDTRSFAQSEAFAPRDMPMAPPPPAAAGKPRVRKREEQRRMRKGKKVISQRQQALLGQDLDKADGFAFSDEAELEDSEGAMWLNEEALEAPKESLDFDALGLGEGALGSLPVPLSFELTQSNQRRFRANLLAPGEAPALVVETLPRRRRFGILAASVLLVFLGTFFFFRFGFLHLAGLGFTSAGLLLGLWLSWSYGNGGEVAWYGVPLGLVFAWYQHRKEGLEPTPSEDAPDREA